MRTCRIKDLPLYEQEKIARVLAQAKRDYPEDWPFMTKFDLLDRDGENETLVVATVVEDEGRL